LATQTGVVQIGTRDGWPGLNQRYGPYAATYVPVSSIRNERHSNSSTFEVNLVTTLTRQLADPDFVRILRSLLS
jgi:hypothetical protein